MKEVNRYGSWRQTLKAWQDQPWHEWKDADEPQAVEADQSRKANCCRQSCLIPSLRLDEDQWRFSTQIFIEEWPSNYPLRFTRQSGNAQFLVPIALPSARSPFLSSDHLRTAPTRSQKARARFDRPIQGIPAPRVQVRQG